MYTSRHGRAAARIVAASLLCACLGACSGGGGGVLPGEVASIVVQGVADPVFNNGSAPANCPTVPFVNPRIVFDFGGTIDVTSLPLDGPASGGAISIVDPISGTAAVGTWRIDPITPTRAIFDAVTPTGLDACVGGLVPGETYLITIAEGGIRLDGNPLASTATACFTVGPCNPAGPAASLFDRVPGPPSIVNTVPTLAATNPTTTRADLADANGPGSRIVLQFDQNLLPTTVTPDNFLLANTSANAQTPIPIAVDVFLTQGTDSTPTLVTLTTALPLNDGDVHELTLLDVRDFDDQPLTTSTVGLTVADENDDTQVTFLEDFTTTDRRASTEGAISWDGDGVVVANGLSGVAGNGLDGSGTFNTSMTINTDLVLTPGDPDAVPGVYNFTDVQISANLTFSSSTDVAPGESNYPVSIRSLSTIDINPASGSVRLDGSGRHGIDSLSLDATTTSRLGGWGGPGGGNGGAGSPVIGAMSPAGEDGQGCKTDGLPSTPADPGFGGGGGGSAGTAATFPDGPGGGAGGTASGFAGYAAGDPPTFIFRMATSGEPHSGADGLGTGAPPAGQVVATPPSKLIPPLMEAAGGSGGGGGGDRIVSSGGMITLQHCGASGGGGGGAISLTAGGDITLADGTIIDCSGGDGGDSVGFFIGGAGGGSGGSILLQSPASVGLGLGCQFDTDGGLGNGGITATPTMLNGEGGDGGSGVVQIEDADGVPNGEFTNNAIFVLGELFAQPFAFSGIIGGLATSTPVDTQGSPRYQQASFTAVAATIAGTTDVRLVGVAESPSAPGMPATTMTDASGRPLMVGPFGIQEVDRLDGYRYFVYLVSVETTELPSGPGATYPGVDSVTVQYVR